MFSANEFDLFNPVMDGLVSSATSDWMTANDGHDDSTSARGSRRLTIGGRRLSFGSSISDVFRPDAAVISSYARKMCVSYDVMLMFIFYHVKALGIDVRLISK